MHSRRAYLVAKCTDLSPTTAVFIGRQRRPQGAPCTRRSDITCTFAMGTSWRRSIS